MGIPERSREQIEEKLAGLEEVYGTFAVNQTTISLPERRYASVRDRDDQRPIDTYVEVYNDDNEVLQVGRRADAELPNTRVALDESPERQVCRAVEEETGIDCRIEELARVTIAGLRNADDEDAGTLYQLIVVFRATHKSGTPKDGAHWLSPGRPVSPT